MRIDLGLILCFFLECIIMIYYTNMTLSPSKSYRASNIAIIGGYLILFLIGIMGIPIVNIVAFSIINFIIFCFFFSTNYKNAVFDAIMLSVMIIASEFITYNFINYNLNISNSFDISSEQSFLLTFFSQMIYFIVVIIFKQIVLKREDKDIIGSPILITVPIITMLCMFFVKQISFISNNSHKYILILIEILLILINIIVFWVNHYMILRNIQIRNLQKEAYRNELDLEGYKLLQEKYEQTKIIRHDFKEQLSVLESFIKTDNEEALKYMKSMELSLNELSVLEFTDNKILNIILAKKIKECNEEKIEINIHSANPILYFINDIDVVSIFSNLINNAIESCKLSKNKKILIDLYVVNKSFTVIKMENSADKKPVVKDEFLKTSKIDNNSHGLGLKSIYNALKAYHGELNWEYDEVNNIFQTIIMITIP